MSDTAINKFLQYGTNAQRLAFTPSPASGTQPIYAWFETDTGAFYVYSSSWQQITSGGAVATIFPSTIEGRLTTESGVPVSTSDRTSQGTLYFTPSTASGVAQTNGNITLYNGSALVNKAFTELSLALTLTSGKNYDVFVDYNSGTPQLVLSAAWTDDTTRSDALGVQSGIVIKSGTAAYRWVGTIRASGANVTEDSGGITGTTQVGGKRFVWNAYNQVPRSMKVIDTTDTWSYTTDTIRQANGATGNKVEYVTGAAGTLLYATVVATVKLASNTRAAKAGVGIDSTTTFSGLIAEGAETSTGVAFAQLHGSYAAQPGLGYHYVSWNEKGADGTSIFTGDNGADSSQSGLTAWLLG